MNKLFLILMFLFCVSCASKKYNLGEPKVFMQKSYWNDSEEHQTNMNYYVSRENDQHCFKDNPKNKEVITVVSDHITYALDHFYNRVATVNVTFRERNGAKVMYTQYTESLDVKLEMASCFFVRPSLFNTNNEVHYISFRLADN